MDLMKLLTKKKGGADATTTPVLFDPKTEFRTEEQETAVFYFSPENVKPEEQKGCGEKVKGCFQARLKGCFPKKEKKSASLPKTKGCGCFSRGGQFSSRYVSDEQYDAIVRACVERLDPKTRGLNKLGIDESQVEKTIIFQNYKYEEKDGDTFYWRIGEDGRFRSSIYEITYLFLTQEEVFSYQLTLSSEWEKHDEQTYEFHYRDVTSFSSETRQKDIIEKDASGTSKKVYKTVRNEFHIRVPNDYFTVVLGNKPTQEEEDAIQGMKAMLREKKA
jgi:hypothetical protein